MSKNELLEEIEENVFLIRGQQHCSHVYLVKGGFKNVLIDTGVKGNFPRIVEGLSMVGLKVTDIHLVINTHEHFDHVGSNMFFHDTSITAAHRFAATKIELQDEYVVHAARHGEEIIRAKFHLWLENRVMFDLGNTKLKIFHTPGHTSGCICIFEPFKGYLFTGDTVFSRGTISKISESGSYGDYINSLERLNTMRIKRIFPGHGEMCEDPVDALNKAVDNARKKLLEYKVEVLNSKLGLED